MLQEINEYFEKNIDLNYRKFTLRCNELATNFLGVRLPIIRKLAKDISKKNLSYIYYEENNFNTYENIMLHIYLLEYEKDLEIVFREMSKIIPYLNNWGLCDGLATSLKITKKHKEEMFSFIIKYKSDSNPFARRFVIIMCMAYYLDDDFLCRVIDIILNVKGDNYYIDMGKAWTLATLAIKRSDIVENIILNSSLSVWIKRKTIQKMKESYRIDEEVKKHFNELLKEIK
ncbi:MAG: DNA alkylation repair protein [Bacilli bacterium]